MKYTSFPRNEKQIFPRKRAHSIQATVHNSSSGPPTIPTYPSPGISREIHITKTPKPPPPDDLTTHVCEFKEKNT